MKTAPDTTTVTFDPGGGLTVRIHGMPCRLINGHRVIDPHDMQWIETHVRPLWEARAMPDLKRGDVPPSGRVTIDLQYRKDLPPLVLEPASTTAGAAPSK